MKLRVEVEKVKSDSNYCGRCPYKVPHKNLRGARKCKLFDKNVVTVVKNRRTRVLRCDECFKAEVL